GLVAAVCFAEIGHDVVCVDNDENKVAALESGDTLIHEKHLADMLKRYRDSKIRFTTDLHEATRDSQAIFIAVGTPQSESGDADLFYVVSNPEFLREGTAVEDFLHPDRIVVGADSQAAANLLAAIDAPLTSGEY